jgi:adenosylcobinamide-phosphate synthase|tara:strand:- start:261 stop:1325 length:1065 start_codon:yes stop_codon:yes gene_type:complete
LLNAEETANLLLSSSILFASLLDRIIGDPAGWIHPVVVMGWWISKLQQLTERHLTHQQALRWAGFGITIGLVGGSLLFGQSIEGIARWAAEQNSWTTKFMGVALLSTALASALAGRSLEQAVNTVLLNLPKPPNDDVRPARQALAWIVGRDTRELSSEQILRACAETSSENAVDGLFAPLFWMWVGALLWMINSELPGPLALAWAFKASSTLDSMLGYRRGKLRWLGTAGARLDDLLTWLPCRLVMVSLPMVSHPFWRWAHLIHAAESDGRFDPSPNAGRSEAIYGHCTGIKMGGANKYGNDWLEKPVLAGQYQCPDQTKIKELQQLSQRLLQLWIVVGTAVILMVLSMKSAFQ